MNKQPPLQKRIRCAVYTRKSTEEGLEQEFNSLDAQREAGEAYITSQRHEGWTLVPDYYDDGGFSGGTLERPGLKRLMKDIETGLIDIVVVYKIDRLTRSLADFAKLVEVFEARNVSFVSVTQQFNTTTSMGRLTLNILLSFAQFEREVIGERVRDKVAASKRKGMWMGGCPPLGYDAVEKKLITNPKEAELIRHIFQRFITLRSCTTLARELRVKGCRTKSYTTKTGRDKIGTLIDKGYLYKLLGNPMYLGEIHHKGQIYDGQHEAIIDRDTWNAVQAVMQESPYQRASTTRRKTPALLKGVLKCSGCLCSMTPTHTRKKGKLYRYYAPSAVMKAKCTDCPVGIVPAAEVEEVVLNQLTAIFRTPEMVVNTWKAAYARDDGMTEKDVVEALGNVQAIWDQLFPAEQARILHLLIAQVVVSPKGVDLRLRTDGLTSLVNELQAREAA
ncbi:MAG: recombinase family protein [Thalassospira sp.]|nr:recombinase family protein [Thalassospira sp.]